MPNPKQTLINLYTDGACSTNGTWSGGAGLYVELDEEKQYYYMGASETTNNIMELKAFQFALHYGLYYGDVETKVNIYTDSAYIVNCLAQKWYVRWEQNGWRNSKKEPVANKEIWEDILSLYRKLTFHDLNIYKVKGHSNNHGNNEADKLAVKGRNEDGEFIWRRLDGI